MSTRPFPLHFYLAAPVLVAGVSLSSAADAAVPVVQPKVLKSHPHDTGAFTQGFLLHEGRFFESTGQYGKSTLREVGVETGEVIRKIDLDRAFFGEGLARVDDRLLQLTWQNQAAFEYDLKTFERTRTFEYTGEGWGLCFDGARLVMTNGSGTLFFRDPKSFELEGQISVTVDGKSTTRLNELECVGDLVYANVWQSSEILQVDPASGHVLTRIDASLLVKEQVGKNVLNGIAFEPSTQHFFLTGKHWSKVYEVSLDFVAGSASEAPSKENSNSAGGYTPSCACGIVGENKNWGVWGGALGLFGLLLRRLPRLAR